MTPRLSAHPAAKMLAVPMQVTAI